jgi:hypothetical protein
MVNIMLSGANKNMANPVRKWQPDMSVAEVTSNIENKSAMLLRTNKANIANRFVIQA